jgi:hypothetical protein
MTPILSILTPSIPDHRQYRELMYTELVKQIDNLDRFHPSLGEVELLCHESKPFLNGGHSIGKKREGLVGLASGKYLCFLDSDDMPSPNYIETLVRMCHEDKDVVTFRDFTTTDFYWTIIDMSLNHEEDEQATPDRIVKRRPWLVCPVRSEYAKQFEFPDINYGEDAIWMSQVLTLCKTEVHTDQILRSYKHSSKTSMADQIINAGHK